MSGDKRWFVDDIAATADGGPLWVDLMSAMTGALGSDDAGVDLATDLMEAIRPHIDREVTDAARLRSLAATFDNHLNRDKSFTGAQVAAMLRDGDT